MKSKKTRKCRLIFVIGAALISAGLVYVFSKTISSVSSEARIFKVDRKTRITGEFKTSLQELGLWDFLPDSSKNISLFWDLMPDPDYYLTFESSIEDCWSFAQKVTGKTKRDFRRGNESSMKFVNLGPSARGVPLDRFPWELRGVEQGWRYDSLYVFVLIDEPRNRMYLCLWENGAHGYRRR